MRADGPRYITRILTALRVSGKREIISMLNMDTMKTARIEYPYYASIEDITTNEDGTLNVAKVRVLQECTIY